MAANHTTENVFSSAISWHNKSPTTYVIPLRDPRLVEQSWHQRRDGLPRAGRLSNEQLIACYENLHHLMHIAPYVLIPIDIGPPTQEYLEEIFPNCKCTTELSVFLKEWPKLNQGTFNKEPIPTSPEIEAIAQWWGYSTVNDSQS